MPTLLENLQTARDNMGARLAEITTSPKPSYSIDGQAFSWTEYMQFLLDGIKSLDEQIAATGGGEKFLGSSQAVT